jgi:hypothetical protein
VDPIHPIEIERGAVPRRWQKTQTRFDEQTARLKDARFDHATVVERDRNSYHGISVLTAPQPYAETISHKVDRIGKRSNIETMRKESATPLVIPMLAAALAVMQPHKVLGADQVRDAVHNRARVVARFDRPETGLDKRHTNHVECLRIATVTCINTRKHHNEFRATPRADSCHATDGRTRRQPQSDAGRDSNG